MKRIGAIFVDKTYGIYHAISTLIELSQDENNEVIIMCRVQNHSLISNILLEHNCSKIEVKVLRPYWYIPLSHYLEIKLQLRTFLFFKYKKLLRSFDAILCTQYLDLGLKKHVSHDDTKLIFVNHGVSNRPYSFDPKITEFDHFFMFGNNEENIRKKLGQLTSENASLIGYPKYDFTKKNPKIDFFKNNKPTIIYNPHWVIEQTSYFKYGIKILDFFAQSKDYNLIFAPHSLLYARNKKILFQLKKYKKSSNILIDLGSEKSNDMTYTKSADLFLGDVSSQALEFLLCNPKPCLFINSHNLNHDYISWDFGDIISNVNDLKSELEKAFKNHGMIYKKVQEDNLPEIFFQGEHSATKLASKKINHLIKDKRK